MLNLAHQSISDDEDYKTAIQSLIDDKEIVNHIELASKVEPEAERIFNLIEKRQGFLEAEKKEDK
jgi:hypothetical protein